MNISDAQQFGGSSALRAGRSVLLADDNPTRLQRMSAHLTAKGFTVRTAATAAEALGSARGERPDAIISDVNIPELDGFVLTSLLRCEESLNRVPIILVTSHREAGVQMAAAAGAQLLIDRSEDFESESEALVD